ncbi:hypothetical protein COCNU_scaffold008549G000190 [Cocos nucifera]|nr:hypothetical protein [Cocos nucifera]
MAGKRFTSNKESSVYQNSAILKENEVGESEGLRASVPAVKLADCQLFHKKRTGVMDAMAAKSGALLLTDDAIFPVQAGLSAIKNLGSELVVEDDDVVVVTQCGTLGGKLQIESGSLDVVVSVWKAPELDLEEWLEEFGRVLKPGGRILVQTPLLSTEGDKIKGKKASWTMGSSFPIEKGAKTVPKIQTDGESDLIDEDSLLTEEDLKKPQLPPGSIHDRTYFGYVSSDVSCGRKDFNTSLILCSRRL